MSEALQLSLVPKDSEGKPCTKPSLGNILSRDEMNLAEFPLAVLSTRSNPKVKTLEFRDTQRLKSGDMIEREWIITGADKFGLPTSTDDDVILGLMQLTMAQGFKSPKVYFTRYELLKILQWSTEGRSYTRLTKSLDRLSGVRIRAANAFYDNKSKSFQTRNFGIIDAYEINDERGSKHINTGEPPKSHFIWSEVLFDSFKSGFIKKLNMDLYFSLKSSVSRRLYRFLDKHFYYKPVLEMPLKNLAFEKIGLSRNYKYVSSIKQQLEPGLEELKEVGFILDYSFSKKGAQTGIKILSSTLSKSTKTEAKEPSPEEVKLTSLDPKAEPILKALCERGMHEKQARKLLGGKSSFECDKISKIIAYYDYLVVTNDHKVSKNKIGFLYRAVESPQKFSLPKRFESFVPEKPKPQRTVVKESVQDKEAYEQFVEKEVSAFRSKLSLDELKRIKDEIEVKFVSLRRVLSEDKFQEAIDGCLRDELAKKASLPDFKAWQKGGVF